MNNLLEESMPFIGLLPFLRVDKMILYKNVDESMPFIGLLPFLQKIVKEKRNQIEKSQCPLSGFFHFYALQRLWNRFKSVGVNALYRASSISTMEKELILRCSKLSQCPLSGFFHFYAPLWERPKMKHLRTRFCK